MYFLIKGIILKKKYILFSCTNKSSDCKGWADRLKGIISAYGISLITERQLVINITHPCSLTNFIEPNEIKWDINLPTQLGKYFIDFNHNFTKDIISNMNFLDYHKEEDVIEINPRYDYITALASNPKHHEKLKELGYRLNQFNSFNLFDKWYKKLFKFEKSLENEYQKILKSLKPTSNHRLICAQIRIGGKKNNSQFNDLHFMNRNKSTDFWEFIRNNFLPNITKYGFEYKIFVTSDTPGVFDEAIKEFGSKIVVASKDLGENIAR